jgi:hypothetical protein
MTAPACNCDACRGESGPGHCARWPQPTVGQTVKLVDADRAREIIEAGGSVHRDQRYNGDYKYIVDSYGPAGGAA